MDATIKGINLALRWGLKEVELRTDSATVLNWVQAAVTEQRRVKTKGASEMIIMRRVGILRELIAEFGLRVSVSFVPSARNKADNLTRVKRRWMDALEETRESAKETCCLTNEEVKDQHAMHHMGVDRTLHLARKVDPSVAREVVQKVVKECVRCQSIDPAPASHLQGDLQVGGTWKRLAVDVTHYRGVQYLTMIDCGPSRFAIWKELRRETASEVASTMNAVFLERGPVDEVLMDNGAAFRSGTVREMLERWNTRPYFRAAYRPEGNGIVERNHRTIKALAERGGTSPGEALFWYNMTPRSGQVRETVPQEQIFQYVWRHPSVPPPEQSQATSSTVRLGEEVWVKPPGARCTTQWARGTVTARNSDSNVSVDGMPRHILDLRPVERRETELRARPIATDQAGGMHEGSPRRSQRNRQPPVWTSDYVM